MNAVVNLIIRIDHALFSAINSLASRNFFLDGIAKIGADDHIIPLVLALLIVLMLFAASGSEQKRDAVEAILCAAIALAVVSVILVASNHLFFRPRPFVSVDVNLIFYSPTDSSFPSNGASIAFALSFAVLLYRRGIGWVMVALSTIFSISRVFCGIHYPADILAGLLVGFAAAAISRACAPLYHPLTDRLYLLGKRVAASWGNPDIDRWRGRVP